MKIDQIPLFQHLFASSWLRQQLKRGQTLIVTVVALLTLLSATVAIGQASQDYDLACRSIMSGGGRIIGAGNFGVNGALGIAIAAPNDGSSPPTYSVHSADYGLRAGFLPGYPTGQAATAAVATIAPNQGDPQAVVHMPIIYGMIVAVRGGCDPNVNP